MAEPVAEMPYMPDYGVQAQGWRPLPWSWAAERLGAGRSYWVVTVSGAGAPHALPVWGVWDDDEQRFAFSCGPRSRKARNLAANPRVAVALDDTVECLSLQGSAEVVTDDARRQEWARRYVGKYQPLFADLDAAFVLAHLVVEVTPARAVAVIEREEDFASRPTRWRFAD
ncbi:pyridoxamine 5'-phosphate oxidase family protein [Rhodococcus sp. X156]|uniref:pyridoxamine 5'-phosphate oxidase family protein n=1 Tax=Rhodococcus sp. X156 TaxID=2499145 RepID=UPI000FD73070|nr:pyridoxamine 5'-phosphate oxidase family protein [Rhodococcus sp. X156]